jgi:hypothetical protein
MGPSTRHTVASRVQLRPREVLLAARKNTDTRTVGRLYVDEIFYQLCTTRLVYVPNLPTTTINAVHLPPQSPT